MRGLFESHLQLAGTVMDMQLQRQNVIMGNISNVNTPGYKPRELKFESELQAALNLDFRGKMARTDEGHMPAVFDPDKFGPELFKEVKPGIVHGEDRVNLDKEMVAMAKNNLQYSALSQVTKHGFDGLKQIITEGSK